MPSFTNEATLMPRLHLLFPAALSSAVLLMSCDNDVSTPDASAPTPAQPSTSQVADPVAGLLRLPADLERPDPERAMAFPLNFTGTGPYRKQLGADIGVVFEDDGKTGYFYATDGTHSHVFDALHIYDRSHSTALQPGDEVFIVWSPSRMRAGLFFAKQFHAVFDFKSRRGVCRTGIPPASPTSTWSPQGHGWDSEFIAGLEP